MPRNAEVFAKLIFAPDDSDPVDLNAWQVVSGISGLPVAIVDYGAPTGWLYAVPTQTATTVIAMTVLHSLVINTTAAATITLYDGPSAAAGTKFATLKASIAEGTYYYDAKITTGKLTIVLAGASDVTVFYALP